MVGGYVDDFGIGLVGLGFLGFGRSGDRGFF